jgi:S-adenosylmethionine:tRNA ribosyltransferase-isomerase
MKNIDLKDYNYELPAERIAQYPVSERDLSQILINKGDIISKDIFRNIDEYLPSNSLLVFNNSKVIRARILFRKKTGAVIEVLCLEPIAPVEYELSFSSKKGVEWKCIIGNLKKWKGGIISASFIHNSHNYELNAERLLPEGEAWRIRFSWNCKTMSFGEVIEVVGHLPLPPYINRADEINDNERYQTIYSSIKGSVAAPTAGLHFTKGVLDRIKDKGIRSVEITLHVGAGTFQPIKTENISEHEMHCEHFFITRATIELLLEYDGKIIPVGTTSVRTIESLYWLGVKAVNHQLFQNQELSLGQWEAYSMRTDVSVSESLEALLNLMKNYDLSYLHASTSIIIIPGYNFRLTHGIITNFHQPMSTLLLLVSAWTGKKWKKIYDYAIEEGFRFLSYGDCSLLLK